MRHIQKVVVTYDDGWVEEFEGRGVANVVNSAAPPDKDSNMPVRDYRYLTLTLDIPIPIEVTGE